MSLRVRLNLIVTLLIASFTAALVAVVIDDARRAIREEMEASSKVTVQWFTNVLSMTPFTSASAARGNAELLDFMNQLGRVRAHDIRVLGAEGQVLYQSPPSIYKPGREAPRWFAATVAPKLQPVALQVGERQVILTQDASRAVLDAWDDMQVMLLIVAGLLVLINFAVFWLVGSALKPVASVLLGLSDMEKGKLHTRLSDFPSPEFAAISQTFNRMAEAIEEAHQQNARLALIAHQSSDAILITDAKGEVTFWNPAAEALFGFKADEILGLSARLLTPASRAQELAEINANVFARRTIDNLETERCTKQGQTVQVALSAAPHVDPDSGEVIGAITSLRDITEHKRVQEAERELESNRELTHMIQASVEDERRSIARELHDELGQCVTAVKTIGAVIANKTKGSQPEIHQSAQTIVDVTSHIYEIVHGMIRKLRPSALDHLGLAEALNEMLVNWRARNPGLEVELTIQGDIGRLGETVNIALYRIVQECLTNVVKHSQASKVEILVVRTSESNHGDGVRVTVADNGKGLVERAEPASRFGIMGMRERVQALEGEFAVESEPGRGVRVVAHVPLTPRSKQEQAA